MPAPKTDITEIVTGLATLARGDDVALGPRPAELRNVDDATWERLVELERAGDHRALFAASWANGRVFLRAEEGLRGRRPLAVEWKGPTRAPGDEVVPADLRIDHVYLVSCKYLSGVLANSSPARLFDHGLAPGAAADRGDWYAEVAATEYQALYAEVRADLRDDQRRLPPAAVDLTPAQRSIVRPHLDAGFSGAATERYHALSLAVGRASADRWKTQLTGPRTRERMLWRLLRLSAAPYFVLGTSRQRSLRLRVMTPWDWRQAFELRRFDVWGDDVGQPVVRWTADVHDREAGGERTVAGHVEIRWSHGRFGRPPEAKVYLDTPHHRVPGYVTIG